MPKLSEERRKQIHENTEREQRFWDKIEHKYHKSEKDYLQCRLCGDMVVGIGFDGVVKALEEHEKAHPEYEEWIALGRKFDFTDLRDISHDHDCVFVECACVCGCKGKICVGDLPSAKRASPTLCALCQLYQGRGHVEHRLPETPDARQSE